MSGVAALVYADWRATINEVRRIWRSPGRVMLWLVYAVALSVFIASRLVVRRSSPASPDTLVFTADYFACTTLLTLVVVAASGWGAIGIFRTRAEARFIIGSPLPAPAAIAYLHVRELLGQSYRYVFSLVYFFFVFAPRTIGAVAGSIDFLLVVGVLVAGTALAVPRRLLTGRWATACSIAGVPLAAAALVPALRDAIVQARLPSPALHRVVALLPNWHPGAILLAPSPWWLLATLGLAAGGVAVLAAAGRDAYPELYELALARIDRRAALSRRRQLRAAPRVKAVSRSLSLPAISPAVPAFVWKSIVEMRRVMGPRALIAVAVACGVAGYAAIRLTRAHAGAFEALTITASFIVVFVTGRGDMLPRELARPFFWLAPQPMFERLLMLAAARSWRAAAAFILLAAGVAAGGGSVGEIMSVALVMPSLVVLTAGVNFAAFALFPSASDRNGPIAFIRSLASLGLGLPPLVVFVIAADGFGVATAGLAAMSLLAWIEGGLLIGLAAARLDGRADRLRS